MTDTLGPDYCRQLFTHCHAPVLVSKGLDGTILAANKQVAGLLGIPVDQLLTMNSTDLIVQRLREATLLEFKEQLAEFGQFEVETLWQHSNGTAVPISIAGSAIYQDGQLTILQICSDRRVEHKLAQRTALLLETARIAKIGGWELDLRTMQPLWSEQTFRIHEIPLGEQPTLDEAVNFYHPDDRKKIKEAVETAVATGRRFDLHLRIITAKGNHLRVRSICEPHLVDGKVTKLRGTFQDETLETSLRETVRVKNLIFETSMAANMIRDAEGRVQEVNPAFLELWGYETDELIGKNVSNLFENREEMQRVQETLDTQGAYQGVCTARRKNGDTFIAEAKATRLVNPSTGEFVGYHATILDISESWSTQQALAQSERRYRRILESLTVVVLAPKSLAIEFVSQSASRLLHAGKEDLVGSLVPQMLEHTLWAAIHRDVLKPTGRPIMGHKFDRGDGLTLYLDIRIAAAGLVGDDRIVISFDDSSDRHKAISHKTRADELAVFNDAMIGRESRIIELKEEVNRICKSANLPTRYPEIWATPDEVN